MRFRRLLTILLTLALGASMSVLQSNQSAQAASTDGLQNFYTDVGNLTLSLDAMGTLSSSGTIQVTKPTGGRVKKAFLFSASTGLSGYLPTDSDITLDSKAVAWNSDWTRASHIGSYNVAADVTSLVSARLDAAEAGTQQLVVDENSSANIDGEVLAVIWSTPTARSRTIVLMYGALAPGGDHFQVNLSESLKPSDSATLSLGISYGYQPAGQYSTVSVNGNLVTSSAGGYDDGEAGNGALITVGGVGDSTKNPSDPAATDSCDTAPRCDDELYDLKAAVDPGATSFSFNTTNPSNDDNIFLAAFDIGADASVGGGFLLTPGVVAHDTSTEHQVWGRIQTSSGVPITDGSVSAKVVSGPNEGLKLSSLRLEDTVVFYYSSSKQGTDTIQATYTAPSGEQQLSNLVTQRWFQPVDGSWLGWAWPALDSEATITWSYGGDHRYMGNVYQGAANWNATDTRLNFVQWAGGEDAIQLRVADASADSSVPAWQAWLLGGDTYASTTIIHDVDDQIEQITILMYQRSLDAENDEQRTKVATHEMGHAVGLDHTTEIANVTKAETPSVMWQGQVGGSITSTPQKIDTSRVDGLYP